MYHDARVFAIEDMRAADWPAVRAVYAEGIERGYELPDPMEKNLYHLSPDERRRLGIEQLPETLGEAIELTAESELVLRTLGEHMFTRYVELKRKEWDDYRVQVSAWELDRYLSVL